MTCPNCKEKCEHKLEHCETCDCVYCTKCNKVWDYNSITIGTGTWIDTGTGSGCGCGQYYTGSC